MTSLQAFALAAAIVLVSQIAPARAADWKKHEYKNEGFSIEFSGNIVVKQTDVSIDTLSKLESTTSYVQDGGATLAYVMAATHFKDSTDFAFDAGVKGTMDTYSCKLTETDKASNDNGKSVREIHASKCVDGSVRVGARFVMVGKWFYQVVYLIGPSESVSDADHFLQSFKLIAR